MTRWCVTHIINAATRYTGILNCVNHYCIIHELTDSVPPSHVAIIVSTLSNNKLHTKSINRIAKHLSAKLTRKMLNHPGTSLE